MSGALASARKLGLREPEHRHRRAGGRRFAGKLPAIVAPAEAVFLDAKIESELVELPDDEGTESALFAPGG
ncbi:hypothetical protein [Planotetraspora sp. GP83]|uniref:hypothetical protein n=1 Tax=Planotetraspora sp. GP83 TaxID=3156264 RepID=UPI0035141ADA